MADLISFDDRLRRILRERRITQDRFSFDTGISLKTFFYKKGHKHHRANYMAIAYYFGMDVEELVAGTDAEIDWYGDAGI